MRKKRTEETEKEVREQGQRFRKERQRLDLSAEDVASICKGSAAAVFAWEAGRSRIPLIAAEKLWAHGFDIESVISGQELMVELPAYPENAPQGIPVPKHLLSRHGISDEIGFAYHSQVHAENLLPSGAMLAMRWLPEYEIDILTDSERIVLFEPERGGQEFLCMVTPSRKGTVLLGLGDGLKKAVKCDHIFEHCKMVGELAFQISYKLPIRPEKSTHLMRLQKTLGITLR